VPIRSKISKGDISTIVSVVKLLVECIKRITSKTVRNNRMEGKKIKKIKL